MLERPHIFLLGDSVTIQPPTYRERAKQLKAGIYNANIEIFLFIKEIVIIRGGI